MTAPPAVDVDGYISFKNIKIVFVKKQETCRNEEISPKLDLLPKKG